MERTTELTKVKRSKTKYKQRLTMEAILYEIRCSAGSQCRTSSMYLETWPNLGMPPIRRAAERKTHPNTPVDRQGGQHRARSSSQACLQRRHVQEWQSQRRRRPEPSLLMLQAKSNKQDKRETSYQPHLLLPLSSISSSSSSSSSSSPPSPPPPTPPPPPPPPPS